VGPCIREIYFATSTFHFRKKVYDRPYVYNPEEEGGEIDFWQMELDFMRAYRHDLLSVLRDSSNLPHLQAIDHNAETKNKGGSDDPYFIDSMLYSSTIQQLSFRELSFPSPCSWVLSGHKPDYCQLQQ
jgi:hypothetical protein